jgi:hypothetical protein
MKFNNTKIISISLSAITILMFAYVINTYRKTSKLDAPVTITNVKKQKPPDPGRATIKLGESSKTAKRGGSWSLAIATNAWAKCAADLYKPDGKIEIFDDTKKTEAVMQSPGTFRWTWNIPKTADTGTWTVRILCGTIDNLATADVAVSVE